MINLRLPIIALVVGAVTFYLTGSIVGTLLLTLIASMIVVPSRPNRSYRRRRYF